MQFYIVDNIKDKMFNTRSKRILGTCRKHNLRGITSLYVLGIHALGANCLLVVVLQLCDKRMYKTLAIKREYKAFFLFF